MRNEFVIVDDTVILFVNCKGETYEAIFDVEDIEKVLSTDTSWYGRFISDSPTPYVYCGTKGNSNKKIILHRFITDAPEDKVVDHKDGNTLNNKRKNLRLCNKHQNGANSEKRRNASSVYKGVVKQRSNWRVCVRHNYERTIIGTYTDEIVAANVYNHYAKQYFGEFAKLNDVPFIGLQECEKFRSISNAEKKRLKVEVS